VIRSHAADDPRPKGEILGAMAYEAFDYSI
jgi:hypothetical protein